MRMPGRTPTGPWVDEAIQGLPVFLESLADRAVPGRYRPAREGVLPSGEALTLGLAALAVKLHVLLGSWEGMPSARRAAHVMLIKSFQTNIPSPDGAWDAGAFIDAPLVASLRESGAVAPSATEHLTMIRNVVRAESKQAIATLIEVGASPVFRFTDLPGSPEGIRHLLLSLDWTRPWSAGGQASAVAMLLATGHGSAPPAAEAGLLDVVRQFFRSILHAESGAYFTGPRPAYGDLVNGAMKVLTALDWLDEPVHAPERLIDTTLAELPSHEGCHLVDAAYVLHRCRRVTDHRRAEIAEYAKNLLEMIRLHHNTDGGFSYFIGRSQTVYYGVPVTSGLPVSDLHGTMLLTWALSMVLRLIDDTCNPVLSTIRP